MSNKRIITAAVTGAIHVPTQSEYLPITPEQIADDAVRAYEAGAAIAHIHVRDPKDGRPVPDLALFRQVCESIKKRCNIILCITTGGDPTTMTVQQRLAPVSDLKPELASFNSGSFNFALHHLLKKMDNFKFEWEKQYLQNTENNIHTNTFKAMREYLDVYNQTDTKPEFEVYDVGQINNVAYLIENGLVKPPVSI
ncbi:MAG TPA: 3-keto-5-aminohexanoate cleavage protein, partial [Negativicutes bacterium]|nr:3-keto-5-aminohexanoate cleavage protein [Negativicutes bacterium]